MNLRDLLARADRLQRSLAFKVAASVLVVVVAIGGLVWYSVALAAQRDTLPLLEVNDPASWKSAAAEGGSGAGPGGTVDPKVAAAQKAARESALAIAGSINDILERRLSPGGVAVAIGLGAGVSLVVIWLNLALTYLAIAAIGLAVAVPMLRAGGGVLHAGGTVLAGVLALAASFAALVQLLRTLLAPSHPVFSIARNVVDEAVRMKVSLVFIVLLIGGLALLPTVLDTGAPLRYRVQGFLSYGLAASYWITVLMAMILACSTVAFEQRDKIVWQTMTKPVAAWQFVVGKWLGVWAVAGLLLAVATAGVFLFTEYLRNQPAQGEVSAFVAAEGPISLDRLLLETQILTARESVPPAPPALREEEVEKEIARRGEQLLAQKRNELGAGAPTRLTDDERRSLRVEFMAEISSAYLAVPPGASQVYAFVGLGRAREQNLPLTLRYKVNAGANLPTDTYRLTMMIDQLPPRVIESRLGLVQTETIPPVSVLLPGDVPDDPRVANGNGTLRVQIVNGDVQTGRGNRETISFNVKDFQVSYAVDSFRGNFFRTVGVLWLRIGFLAAMAVLAATFLSFPVATLVAFGTLFAAESVNFMQAALESFLPFDVVTKEIVYYRIPAYWISRGVVGVLDFYGRLAPTEALVEGRLVPWSQLSSATFTLGLITAGILAGASVIFRRRELAIYSGQ